MLEALGLPEPGLFMPYRFEALGGRLWTPGLQTSLLPKGWNHAAARAAGGYGDLSGDALEAKARAVSMAAL